MPLVSGAPDAFDQARRKWASCKGCDVWKCQETIISNFKWYLWRYREIPINRETGILLTFLSEIFMKFINKRILIILSSYLCSHQSHTAENKSYLLTQLPARRTNTHFFAHTDFIIPSIYANMCIYRPGGQLWKVWELVDLLRKHLFSGPWLSGVWPPILSPREKKEDG